MSDSAGACRCRNGSPCLKLDGPKLSKVGLELKTVLARFQRPLTLAFNLTQKWMRGPNQQLLKDCSVSAAQAKEKGTCEIAADASQLLINIEP